MLKYDPETNQKQVLCERGTFVLGVDVVADVQVEVRDLQVVGRLAHVVGAEQPGHGGALVGRRGRLLGAHLLGRGGGGRHLEEQTRTQEMKILMLFAIFQAPAVFTMILQLVVRG